jgi:hypothetical protein
VRASGAAIRFAITDFDGDNRPDLASVDIGSHGSSLANYTIQLQLSTAGWQSLTLMGPSGGLRIAARDLNGDQIPDLIVSSQWHEEPLAVFVNDGRGSFSWANPSSFPSAPGNSEKTRILELPQRMEAAANLSQFPVGDLSEEKQLFDRGPPAEIVPIANSESFLSFLLLSLLGRAPPKPSRA